MRYKLIFGTLAVMIGTSLNTYAADNGHQNPGLRNSVVDYHERGRNVSSRPVRFSSENPKTIIETEMEHSRKNILKQFNVGFEITAVNLDSIFRKAINMNSERGRYILSIIEKYKPRS